MYAAVGGAGTRVRGRGYTREPPLPECLLAVWLSSLNHCVCCMQVVGPSCCVTHRPRLNNGARTAMHGTHSQSWSPGAPL